MSWERQKVFTLIVLLGAIWVAMSAWDERDFAELRAEAQRAKADGVRYLVEESGYRPAAYESAFHCHAPRKGERLVMQFASPRDPGKGYRCTYWLVASGDTTVTWSRSPELTAHYVSRNLP